MTAFRRPPGIENGPRERVWCSDMTNGEPPDIPARLILEGKTMLPSAKIVGFIQVTDRGRAREFYVDVLGLKYVGEDPFALVVESNGTRIRIGEMPGLQPAQFTVLGWEVADMDAAVLDLQSKGVELQKYGLKGQDE